MTPRTFSPTGVNATPGLIAWLLAGTIACSDGPAAPTPQSEPGASAAIRWNEIARAMVISHASSPPHASRTYAYVSLASWAAWRAADNATVSTTPRPSPSAAAARAAAVVLEHIYPGASDFLLDELRSQALARRASGESPERRAAGEVVGEDVARLALERAGSDGADATWNNVFPEGPAYYTDRLPALPMWGGVQPWLVASGRDMRAPPPPEFGSEDFAAALREVRQISDSRTPQQLAIALHWADGAGTATPPGHWNVIAVDLLRRHRVSESEALRTLALMNMAMADAMIGCWDSKYAYWYLRPWEADVSITTPIGRPNHPSYPSGHSCSSAAGATVLAGLFPGAADALHAMADEAGLSRLYGGIHYRFDLTAGKSIGRECGALAVAVKNDEPQFFATLGWTPQGTSVASR
jgi:hypothetical protein